MTTHLVTALWLSCAVFFLFLAQQILKTGKRNWSSIILSGVSLFFGSTILLEQLIDHVIWHKKDYAEFLRIISSNGSGVDGFSLVMTVIGLIMALLTIIVFNEVKDAVARVDQARLELSMEYNNQRQLLSSIKLMSLKLHAQQANQLDLEEAIANQTDRRSLLSACQQLYRSQSDENIIEPLEAIKEIVNTTSENISLPAIGRKYITEIANYYENYPNSHHRSRDIVRVTRSLLDYI
ncbi:MAG: hypothetical protein HQL81_01220 [Magnetococcales bacterium]|nr:hypothetical protein [Magnetococcales bacterium]MBF0631541.1 hypothetical protein [Magnetococcales bacterium]